MNVSREVFDYDRVARQEYQGLPKRFLEYPNLSEVEFIGEETQRELYRHLTLPNIPPDVAVSRAVLRWDKEHITKNLFRTAHAMSRLITQMEGSLEVVLGDYVWDSCQSTWGERENVLFASGVGFVLRAVEIECGKAVLEQLNAVDADVLRNSMDKVRLPQVEPESVRVRGFSPFPPAQTRLNRTMALLGDIVCDNEEERFALESGASGMYYIIEDVEERSRGFKK